MILWMTVPAAISSSFATATLDSLATDTWPELRCVSNNYYMIADKFLNAQISTNFS